MGNANEQEQNELDGKMRAINVRFTPKVYAKLEQLADEYGVSVALVVRLAVDGNLAKYLGEVKYIDSEHARQINKNICTVGYDLREIGNQLRRIGINYNQELKLKHIEAKNMSDYEKQDAVNTVKKNTNLLDKKELESLMVRYENATKKLGESLWHIQE